MSKLIKSYIWHLRTLRKIKENKKILEGRIKIWDMNK